MLSYEFQCEECDFITIVRLSIKTNLKETVAMCAKCGSRARPIISKGSSFLLKDKSSDMCGWSKDGYKKVDRLAK